MRYPLFILNIMGLQYIYCNKIFSTKYTQTMDYTDSLNRYIEDHTSDEDPVLKELYRQTHLKTVRPHIIAGHQQGKLLEFISKMARPKRILEIGTFTGYSAICLAKGLIQDGELITIERNDELKDFAETYFAKAGLDSHIQLITGEALSVISGLSGYFDIVFIDAEKSEYTEYYKAVIEKVPSGGIILADNVLWYGNVVKQSADRDTEGINVFNTYVKEDQRVENIILSDRDGLMVARKL